MDSVVWPCAAPLCWAPKAPAARNVILLTGGQAQAGILHWKKLPAAWRPGAFCRATDATLDLALYPNSGAEKLFPQDLYAALHAPGEILAFEHYESCYPGFLKTLSDLAVKGSAPLSSRYLVNKEGIPVDAGTALAPGAQPAASTPAANTSSSTPTRAGRHWLTNSARRWCRHWGISARRPPTPGRILAALAAQQLNALAQKIRTPAGADPFRRGRRVRDYVAAQCTTQKGAAGLSVALTASSAP